MSLVSSSNSFSYLSNTKTPMMPHLEFRKNSNGNTLLGSWPLLVLNFGKDFHDVKHDAVVNFVSKFLFTPKVLFHLGGH